MHRRDEVLVNKTNKHGILQSQIVLEQDKHVCTSPENRSYPRGPFCQSSMGVRIRREDRCEDSTPVRSLAGM